MIGLRFILAAYLVVAPMASACCAFCPDTTADGNPMAACPCCKPSKAAVASCCTPVAAPEAADCECCFEQAIPINDPILPPTQDRTFIEARSHDLLFASVTTPSRQLTDRSQSPFTSWLSILDTTGQSFFCVWLN